MYASGVKDRCSESEVTKRHSADWGEVRAYIAKASGDLDRARTGYGVFQHFGGGVGGREGEIGGAVAKSANGTRGLKPLPLALKRDPKGPLFDRSGKVF